nr:MauE/DoxX family redox-associated membrane protein [Microlunatus panaciterrae]
MAAVFVVAGALKVVDPVASVQAVRAYQLLPAGLETLVGWGLPFAEIALGLLILVGLHTRAAAAVAGLLLLTFIGGVISVAARGLSIDCGCFGGGGRVAPGQTAYAAEIARDVGLLLAAGWLVWRPRSHLSVDGAFGAHRVYRYEDTRVQEFGDEESR